jgi:hypothetical protein
MPRYGEHESMNPFSGKKSGKEDEGRDEKMARKKMKRKKGGRAMKGGRK